MLFLVATLEVLKTVSINITVFWDLTPSSLLDHHQVLAEPTVSILKAEE
jgi:hypothetical protein